MILRWKNWYEWEMIMFLQGMKGFKNEFLSSFLDVFSSLYWKPTKWAQELNIREHKETGLILLQSIKSSHFTRNFKRRLSVLTLLSVFYSEFFCTALTGSSFGTSITTWIIGPAVNDLTAHSSCYSKRYVSQVSHCTRNKRRWVGLFKPVHHGSTSCMLTTEGFSTLSWPWIKLH